MMNTTVYFNPQWMEALDLLDRDERNAVIGGIVTYQITGTVPDRVGSMAAFVLLKIEVDRRNRRIARERERRRQSARPVEPPADDSGRDNALPPDEPPVRSEPRALPHTPARPVARSAGPLRQETPPVVEGPTACRPRRPDMTPEKKAAIASLVESLLQPRPAPGHNSR